MTAGNLDRKIQIQTRDAGLNADGSQVSTWTTIRTTWAKKKDVPSTRRGEMFTSSQHNDTLFTEWTVRWYAGATGAERIIDELGAIYNVRGVPSELGRREHLVFVAERGAVK